MLRPPTSKLLVNLVWFLYYHLAGDDHFDGVALACWRARTA